MARPLTMRQPHTAELRQLHKVLEEALTSGQRHRAEAILLCAAGLPAVDIAPLLDVPPNTISADLHSVRPLRDGSSTPLEPRWRTAEYHPGSRSRGPATRCDASLYGGPALWAVVPGEVVCLSEPASRPHNHEP
jgi:hypothetical protein